MVKSNFHKGWLSSLLILLTLVGCEQKRSTKFVQGDGENVYSIAAYDGYRFSLTTGEALAPGISSKADRLVADAENDVIRDYPSVAFQADGDIVELSNDILNNFDFYGRQNHEYQMEFGFTEDHLVVYKLADKKDLPSYELTYAIERPNGQLAVPMLGYPLSKYAIERVEDSRGKSTDRKATYPKDFLKDATHFAIERTGVVYFDADKKTDLFPVDFFKSDKEWFYEITLVDRPMDDGHTEYPELGWQFGSGRIKFFRTNNSLIGVDVNIPEEAQSLDGTKLRKVVEIPAQWVDFRLVTSGEDAFLKEEMLEDYEAGSKDWEERRYGLLDFRGVNALGSANLSNIKLQRMEVADDYVSFKVYNSNTGLALRYSFSYSSQAVQGVQYPFADANRFGFFRSVKEIYQGALNKSEDSVDQRLFLNRMYPENNDIVFHLTDNSPDDQLYIDAVQRAVDAWDQAFVEAAKGTPYEDNPIRVRFNRNKRVKNGDVRYHKVSFYGYDIFSGLLGYGPSVSDGRTGQIYSSTNHIYLRNYREKILRNLVSYVRMKMGLYDGKNIDGIHFPNQVLPVADSPSYDDLFSAQGSGLFALIPETGAKRYVSSTAEVLSRYDLAELEQQLNSFRQDLMAGKQPILPEGFDYREHASLLVEQVTPDQPAMSRLMADAVEGLNEPVACQNYESALRNTYDEIEDYCMRDGSPLKSYVDELVSRRNSGEDIYRLDTEKDVFYECAQRLMKPTLISTLVHEFGHNFGLRHNFIGSADYQNFPKDDGGIPRVRSTSVMDYSHRDSDRGFKPGTYDVAAVRFGYYGAVEVEDGQGGYDVVDVSREFNDVRDIDQVLADNGLAGSRRDYKYCTDGNIMYGEIPEVEPDCRRWDRGSNPIQAVMSFMDEFNQYMVTNGYRFDDFGITNQASVQARLLQKQLQPMKAYYDKFRSMVRDADGSAFKEDVYYLENEDKFEQLMDLVVHNFDLPYYIAISEEYAARMEQAGKRDLFSVVEGITDPRARSARLEQVIMNELSPIQRYKLAADLSFKFMKELLFSDIQYCVVHFDEDSLAPEFVPFEKFRVDTYNRSGLTINSCQQAEPVLAEQFASRGTVSQVWTVGNRIEDVLFSPDKQALEVKQPLSVGLKGARLAAAAVLADRSPGLAISAENNFLPNFLDNPIYRDIVVEEFRDRMIEGVDPAELLGHAGRGLTPVTRFVEEQQLYSTAWSFFIVGLDVPGQERAVRSRPYLPNFLPAGSFLGRIPEDAIIINDQLGNVYWASDFLPFVKDIMASYSQVKDELVAASTSNIKQYELDEVRQQAVKEVAELVSLAVRLEGQQSVSSTNILYADFVTAMGVLLEYYGLVPAKTLQPFCQTQNDVLTDAEAASEGEGESEDASPGPATEPVVCKPEQVDMNQVLTELEVSSTAQQFVTGTLEVADRQGWPVRSAASLQDLLLSYVQVNYPDFAGEPEVFTAEQLEAFMTRQLSGNGLFQTVAINAFHKVKSNLTNPELMANRTRAEVLTETVSNVFADTLAVAEEVAEQKDQYEAQEKILKSIIGIR
jgi:hypothetical protein